MKTAALACVFLLISARPNAGLEPACPQDTKTLLRVTIAAERNQTGHVTTKLDVEPSAAENSLQPSFQTRAQVFPTVSVEVKTMNCSRAAPTLMISATITAPPSTHAPAGYQLLPGVGLYKVHVDLATWSEALAACYAEGAHLAVVSSPREADALVQLMAHYPKIPGATHNDYMYVGFHDLLIEGRFVTIFGDTLSAAGFDRFIADEPNRSLNNNEDCGLIHRTGGLADVVCTWKEAFICELEL